MKASSWGLLPSWPDFDPLAVPQAKQSAGMLVRGFKYYCTTQSFLSAYG